MAMNSHDIAPSANGLSPFERSLPISVSSPMALRAETSSRVLVHAAIVCISAGRVTSELKPTKPRKPRTNKYGRPARNLAGVCYRAASGSVRE